MIARTVFAENVVRHGAIGDHNITRLYLAREVGGGEVPPRFGFVAIIWRKIGEAANCKGRHYQWKKLAR